MRKAFFFFLVLFIFSGCVKDEKIKLGEIIINNKKIEVEIVDTPDKRKQGLSGQESLCEDCGMLFLFSEKDKHSFWMKDMNFSIDIIWIDGDEIVYMIKKAPKPSEAYIPSYFPEKKADKVLEVNAGFTDENNLKIGDKVSFKQAYY